MGWLLALGVIPLVTFAADERSCNMRDAALPTNSITYVLCEQGLLLVTNDEGATWAQRKIANAGALRAVAFLDVNRGVTVGDGGAILATDDAGRTWKARESGTTENLTDIQMVGEEGWIAGYDGVILHTADGGKTWSKQKSGVALSLEALFFLDAQNGWAVGWAGTVLHTVDGGNKWQPVKIPGATWSLSSITFPDAKNGWIVGFAGQLFRTKDGGATWEAKKTPVLGLADLHRLRRGQSRLDHHRRRFPVERRRRRDLETPAHRGPALSEQDFARHRHRLGARALRDAEADRGGHAVEEDRQPAFVERGRRGSQINISPPV